MFAQLFLKLLLCRYFALFLPFGPFAAALLFKQGLSVDKVCSKATSTLPLCSRATARQSICSVATKRQSKNQKAVVLKTTKAKEPLLQPFPAAFLPKGRVLFRPADPFE
jgi:hypothetical protein